jgi:hypothetical protein
LLRIAVTIGISSIKILLDQFSRVSPRSKQAKKKCPGDLMHLLLESLAHATGSEFFKS